MLGSKIKILALAAISFLASLLGLQHYRNKSKKLADEVKAHQKAKRVNKAQTEALIDAQNEANQRVQDEIDRSHTHRDYFSKR